MWREAIDISVLVGETLTQVHGEQYDDEMRFHTASGKTYKMLHYQSCCETVCIDEIIGDLNDLIGSPITQAEESSGGETWANERGFTDYVPESHTWTFYRLATAKGSVVVRWLGYSNGYYSECVDFVGCDDE